MGCSLAEGEHEHQVCEMQGLVEGPSLDDQGECFSPLVVNATSVNVEVYYNKAVNYTLMVTFVSLPIQFQKPVLLSAGYIYLIDNFYVIYVLYLGKCSLSLICLSFWAQSIFWIDFMTNFLNFLRWMSYFLLGYICILYFLLKFLLKFLDRASCRFLFYRFFSWSVRWSIATHNR